MESFRPRYTQNRVSANTTTAQNFGQNTSTVFSISPGYYAILNECRIVIQFKCTGTTKIPIFIRPPITWINNVQCKITYDLSGQDHVEQYTSQSFRGDVGYMMELLDLSFSAWTDADRLEYLTTPSTIAQAGETFEVAIPLRYLVDPCVTQKFLPVKYFEFQPSWRAQNECVLPATASTTDFVVTMSNMYFCYPTVQVPPRSIPAGLELPDVRSVYVQALFVGAGQTQTNATLVFAGKPNKIFHYFLATGATSAALSTYSLSVNTTSIGATEVPNCITYQQITAGGKGFPISPQYQLTANEKGVGSAALYHELQYISQNFQPQKNTQVTYENFINKYKIYALDLSDCDVMGGGLPFTVQYPPLVLPTNATSMYHIIAVLYEPTA